MEWRNSSAALRRFLVIFGLMVVIGFLSAGAISADCHLCYKDSNNHAYCGPGQSPPAPAGFDPCYVYEQCMPFPGGERCMEFCDGGMCYWA